MIKLNLKTENREHEKIKAYLENNASEILAGKINNGVQIVKDGKTLLNKKDLAGFMDFANNEARKLAAKCTKGVCIDDDTVYGWAIHYFEEDNIEGKLYNADGTEYKAKPVKSTPDATVKKPVSQPKPQLSIFDMTNNIAESAKPETPSTPIIPKEKHREGSPMYQHYQSVKEKYQDCILFYRLGDFYEMFNGDAVTAADVLNLTLTGRDCGLAERVPMTGIPFHAADAYISKLVAQGYKVAIAERLDGDYKKIVERVIAADPTAIEQLVDIDTGEIIPSGENLTVEEMQKFDGDIEEPEELPTVSKLLEGVDMGDEQNEPDNDFDIEAERERLKAFDRNAIVILSDLFGEIFNLE